MSDPKEVPHCSGRQVSVGSGNFAKHSQAMPNPQKLHPVCSPWDWPQLQLNVNVEQKLTERSEYHEHEQQAEIMIAKVTTE